MPCPHDWKEKENELRRFMESERKRKIKSGAEYDDLFPSPLNRDISIRKEADVEDTMELIQRTVPKTLWQTTKIAERLRGKTLDETCSNIWHFVYEHIQYKRDKEGVEQVRSPRRTWWERHEGVDCDCYTEFISSILLNLGIPHKARITKYPKEPPTIPRWQHVYPVVPKDGRLDRALDDRDSYIVIDCVKDDYDDEQPFLECKDYDMRLEYLDGIDDDENVSGPQQYDTTDASDIAALYDDDRELGRFSLRKAFDKIGDGLKKGVRVLNRFVNPGTILLRNGLLLAMKLNMFNVAGKLRYAYLSDAQAKALGINTGALAKLRHIKDRAESIYWQAGGNKENLKKAILKGKGNSDKKVPLNGLFGLDDVYADVDEYNIIHKDDYDELMGLGELGVVGATALAAATSAVAALSAALKQIKGMFSHGSSEEKAFQSEGDKSAPGSASAPADDSGGGKPDTSSGDQSSQSIISKIASGARMATQDNETNTPASSDSGSDQSAQSVLPATTSSGRAALTSDDPPENAAALPQASDQNSGTQLPATSQGQASLPVKDQGQPQGFMDKTTTWVKENPGKSLLIVGAVVGGGFLLLKMGKKKSQPAPSSLSGFSTRKKRHKNGKRKKQKQRIHSIKL